MKIFKVLVVDDSAFIRKSITLLIEQDPSFQVVGHARNGEDALQKIQELSPDVVTMDVEMPVMDGLTCVKQTMINHPTPILMLSSHTKEENEITVQALSYGAVDFFYKDGLLEQEAEQQAFLLKLKAVANTYVYATGQVFTQKKTSEPIRSKRNVSLAIIGSSTGGPSALTKIIEALPSDFPVPLLIVQHMPDGFTKPLAERFNDICKLPVTEVERGDVLEKGHVYIAPAGYQTTIQERNGAYYLNVSKDYSSDQLYKPSIDVTILSAAQFFKADLFVTILTGMGEDGLKGCEQVKKNKGYILAESEETAVVYGMPKCVIDAGYADEQSPIYAICERIKRIVSS